MERLKGRIPYALLERIHGSTELDVGSTAASCAAYLDMDPVFHEVMQPLTQPGLTTCAKNKESAMHHKSDGNEAFGRSHFEDAIVYYGKAVRFMPSDSSSSSDLAVVYVNRATALHRSGLRAEAERDCSRAIALRKSYSKAWYRRALVRMEMLDYEGALSDMQTAFCHETSVKGKQQVQEQLFLISQQLQGVKPQNAPVTETATPSRRSYGETELYWTVDKQWGLRTTSQVLPGALMHFEHASAAILLKEHRNIHCHHCFDVLPADSVACNGCAISQYCSETCRDDAIVEHRFECGGTAWAAVLPVDGVLASRILTGKIQVDLVHHYEKLSPDTKVDLHVASVALVHCLKAACLDHVDNLAFHDVFAKLVLFMATLRSNAMGIVHVYSSDKTSEHHESLRGIQHVTVAQALFLKGSRFNHSCTPNIHASFFKRSLLVHTTQLLPAFWPLEMSYGPQVGETGRFERQAWLRDHYFFICKCPSCHLGTASDVACLAYRCGRQGCEGIVLDQDFPVHATGSMKSFLMEYGNTLLLEEAEKDSELLLHAGCCLKCNSSVDVEKASIASKMSLQSLHNEASRGLGGRRTSDALGYLEQGRRVLFSLNKRRAEMEDIVARMYCDAGDFSAALRHAEESILILEFLYGKDHIAVAYERVKVASLARAAGLEDVAQANFTPASKTFCIYYGSDYETMFPHIHLLFT